ncbi:hypothetical protein CYMTET_45122 [Cymbomonas tetramitiformis]|uniref:Uncharacterized protein n=1 Tax=Cymbomonas tetramitiformis TaxID=36881 RepID=A0AAE0EYC2_9CHLO|nr:hypothetical protein CYMTET_45122 [Cymbomonas tetramitiformis]
MADTPSTEVMNPWEQSTQLHDAASAGDLAAVQSLIARGANVNTLNMHERTPLFLAAVGRHVEVVNTLLSCGLVNDVSPRDECGSTPLQWAVRIGAVEVVSALLKAGADVGDATDESLPAGSSLRACAATLRQALNLCPFTSRAALE